jgi:hypothetical protein
VRVVLPAARYREQFLFFVFCFLFFFVFAFYREYFGEIVIFFSAPVVLPAALGVVAPY